MEGYNNLNIAYKYTIEAGKRRFTWGKGYAWNPVGYINSEKDPVEPQLMREGKYSTSFEYIKSFNSNIFRTFSFNFVALPPPPEIKNIFGDWKKTVLATKMYFLLFDTDIDILSYYNNNNPKQIGIDFSRNIKENIEIHGEVSHFTDKTVYNNKNIDPYSLYFYQKNGFSYLFGLRYLTNFDLTLFCEYYHDDAGLNRNQFKSYFDFLRYNYQTGDKNIILDTKDIIKNYFGAPTIGQNYLYLNMSQKDPFGILYLTVSPALCIYNLDTDSFLLIHELNYKPFTDYEIILKGFTAHGDGNSEFFNRGPKYKIELWLGAYF